MASRAIVITELGDPQRWKIVTKEKPRASPGHAVVHITLRPVNPSDFVSPKVFLGHLKGKEVVTGSEGFGYVEEVGEGVTKVKVGQRVVPTFFTQFYKNGNGSWQDYVEVAEDQLNLIPDTISDEIAAQYVINPWTVYGLLADQNIPKGEYLLQNAAGSVLGRQVIQLAKHWGIKTINVVRRDEVKDELKSLGADEVINSTSEDVVARVKEITGGKGAAGAIDPVCGIQTKQFAASVRDGGKLFLYGALGAPDFDATVGVMDFGRVQIKFWSVSRNSFLQTPEQLQEIFTVVGKLIEEKVIVPRAGKTFKFGDFKQAVLEADKQGREGKVLLAC